MKRSGNSDDDDGGGGGGSGGGEDEDGGGGEDDDDAYAWPIASSLFSFSFSVKAKNPPRLFYIY